MRKPMLLTPRVSKFGRLTFLSELDPLIFSGRGRHGTLRIYKDRRVVCECECGSKPSIYSLGNVRSGHTRSCGCLRAEVVPASCRKANTTHGLSDDPLYKVWQMMVARCHNTRNSRYKWYGARGIAVCNKWRNDVSSFVQWARSHGYMAGLELDRRNNDLGYSPRNCRWVTHKVNMQNSRLCKKAS